MHRNVDVLIIVEHLTRELDSALLLENTLVSHGVSCRIVIRGWDEGPASCFLKPKVIVTPWCYDNKNVESLRRYQGGFIDSSLSIVDLHSEQVTSEDGLPFVLPSGDAKQCIHICWGEYFARVLLSNGVKKDNIVIAGSNRLDLFRDEYRYLVPTKNALAEHYGLNSERPWVLLMGNFSAAFFSESTLSEIEARGISHIRENSALSKRTYREVLRWMYLALVNSRMNGIEFIYRPHPSEPVTEELRELANRFNSFHIIKDEPISNWFTNCSIGLTWCSTSSVEAAFANLPVFMLRPFPVPEYLQFDLLECVEKISTAEEMIETISGVIQGKVVNPNSVFKKRIDYFYWKGPISATAIISGLVLSLLNREHGDFKPKRSLLYAISKITNYCIKRILLGFGVLNKIPKYKALCNNYISRHQLAVMRQRIQRKE